MIRRITLAVLALIALIPVIYCFRTFGAVLHYDGKLDLLVLVYAAGFSAAVGACAYYARSKWVTKIFFALLAILWLVPLANCIWAFVDSLETYGTKEPVAAIYAGGTAGIVFVFGYLASKTGNKQKVSRVTSTETVQ